MRRLASVPLTLCSAVSLLSCFATAGLWVYSGSHYTSVVLRREPEGGRERILHLTSVRGGLYLANSTYPAGCIVSPAHRLPRQRVFNREFPYPVNGDPMGDPDVSVLGFASRSKGLTVPFTPAYRRVPLWFVTALAGVLPATRVLSLALARVRVRRGLCAGCGYDLRETLERCPECGTPRGAYRKVTATAT